MKKWWTMILIGVGALMIGGCSNSVGNTEEGSVTSDTSTNKVTLTYASWDPNQEAGLKVMAEAFEKENPNIAIQFETTPWTQYWTKLEAAATGGNMADIITMHSNESHKYMSNNQLMPLNEFIAESDVVDLNNFQEGIVDLYTLDGEVYALPKDVSAIGLWYNKALFDEAGIDYPDDSWTWETLVDAAQKLTNPDKGIYGFAAPNAGQDGYNSFVFQNEGRILNEERTKSELTNPNTIEALQWWIDLSLKQGVSPTAQQFSENDPTSYLQSGKIAMITHGSWMASQFRDNEYTKENIDVAILPIGKQRATQINGLGWAISAKTKHPEEAKKFLEFLGSKEANEIQAAEGVEIPAYKGLAEQWVKSFEGEFNVQSFVDMIEYGVIRPFSNQTVRVETLETEGLMPAFNGEMTVEEAAESIANQVDDLLSTN